MEFKKGRYIRTFTINDMIKFNSRIDIIGQMSSLVLNEINEINKKYKNVMEELLEYYKNIDLIDLRSKYDYNGDIIDIDSCLCLESSCRECCYQSDDILYINSDGFQKCLNR